VENHSNWRNRKKHQTRNNFKVILQGKVTAKTPDLSEYGAVQMAVNHESRGNDNPGNTSNDTCNGQTKQVFIQNFY